MTTITEIYYEELKSKNFENCRVGLRANVSEGEDKEASMELLKHSVREELEKWYNGDLHNFLDRNLEEKKREIVALDSRLADIRKKILRTQNVLSVLED